MVQKRQFYGIQFTFINSLYNYYELLDKVIPRLTSDPANEFFG
jgi:hypothetical protein